MKRITGDQPASFWMCEISTKLWISSIDVGNSTNKQSNYGIKVSMPSSNRDALAEAERRIAEAKRTRETALICQTSVWRCCRKMSAGSRICGLFT